VRAYCHLGNFMICISKIKRGMLCLLVVTAVSLVQAMENDDANYKSLADIFGIQYGAVTRFSSPRHNFFDDNANTTPSNVAVVTKAVSQGVANESQNSSASGSFSDDEQQNSEKKRKRSSVEDENQQQQCKKRKELDWRQVTKGDILQKDSSDDETAVNEPKKGLTFHNVEPKKKRKYSEKSQALAPSSTEVVGETLFFGNTSSDLAAFYNNNRKHKN
jgi:hypothetical protein